MLRSDRKERKLRKSLLLEEVSLDGDGNARGVLGLAVAHDPGESVVGVGSVVGLACVPARELVALAGLGGSDGVVNVAVQDHVTLVVERDVGDIIGDGEHRDDYVGAVVVLEAHGRGDGGTVADGQVEDELAIDVVAVGVGLVLIVLRSVEVESLALSLAVAERLEAGTGVAGTDGRSVNALVAREQAQGERLGLDIIIGRDEPDSSGDKGGDLELHCEGCGLWKRDVRELSVRGKE